MKIIIFNLSSTIMKTISTKENINIIFFKNKDIETTDFMIIIIIAMINHNYLKIVPIFIIKN